MFTEDVLRICVAQIAKYVGFKFINTSSYEILIDLLSRYILELGKLSVSIANQCNRNEVNLKDIVFVLKSMGLNLDDLSDYLNVNLPFAGPLLPRLPIEKQQSRRISFPTQIECELRKQFYQDWQPSLSSFNFKSKLIEKLEREEKQNIENNLEKLELVDFLEQRNKLKIAENPILNKRILNKISNRINKFNISGFTNLTAKTPNYIYLNDNGQVSSFGDLLPGKLPEPRKPNSSLSRKELKRIKRRQHKEKKRSDKNKSSEHKKNFDKNSLSLLFSTGDYQDKLQANDWLIKELKRKSKEQLEEEDKSKSSEEIIREIVDEMISNVEDIANGNVRLNENFYDENEAAKTLVLLSCDTKNTNSSANSTDESPPASKQNEETNIDYSLATKHNYDLNNNYSTMSDLNNNAIKNDDLSRKTNGYRSTNLTNNKFDKCLKYNNSIDTQLNDVKKLTIKDELENGESMNSSSKLNGHTKTNGTRLKIKLSFDEFKRSSDTSSINSSSDFNFSNSNSLNHSINLNNSELSNNKSADKLVQESNHDSSTKDKPVKENCKRKLKTKKLNNSTNNDHEDDKSSVKSFQMRKKKKNAGTMANNSSEKVYYCPSCSKPDDGSPMIGCDKCLDW